MEKMSVAAEENKERLIRGDTFELKLEKIRKFKPRLKKALEFEPDLM